MCITVDVLCAGVIAASPRERIVDAQDRQHWRLLNSSVRLIQHVGAIQAPVLGQM